MRQEKIIQMIVDARSGWETYKSSIQECLDAYLMKIDRHTCDEKRKQNRSHIYFPKVNAKAKRISDGLSETYFTNDELVKLSKYINTDDDILNKWQKAVDFYTTSQNLYTTFQPIFQEVPFIGTSICRISWAGDTLKIDKVDIDKFFYDVNAVVSHEVKYLVHIIELTVEEIRELQKLGHFNRTFKVDELFNESRPSERMAIHEVYFYENGEWKVTSIYNESVPLRENVVLQDGNPFVWGGLLWQIKDFSESNFIPCYFEPAVASIIPLQHETNTIRNGIADCVKSQLVPKIITSKTAGINISEVWTIGSPIYTSDPNIRTLEQGNPSYAMSVIPVIEQDMAEVTGISPQSNGIAPNRKETATMSNIMANEGGVRLQGYIRTFNETFFEPCFLKVAMLVWKYARADFFMGIDRSEIPSFEVKVNAGIGALNKEVQKQGLIEANQMVGQQLQMAMSVGDKEMVEKLMRASLELLKRILPLNGIAEVEKLLGEDDDSRGVIGQQVMQSYEQPQFAGVIPQQDIPQGVPSFNQL